MNARAWIIGLLLLACTSAATAESWVYWADTGNDSILGGWIRRAHLDGSNPQLLVMNIHPVGLTLDAAGAQMYWTQWFPAPAIWTASINGRNPHVLIELPATASKPTDIEYANGKLYWTDLGGTIWKADLLASEPPMPQVLYSVPGYSPHGLAVDDDQLDDTLIWSFLDQPFLSGGTIHGGPPYCFAYFPLYGPADVAVQGAIDRVIWSEMEGGRICMADYNTATFSVIFVADAIAPGGLAVNPPTSIVPVVFFTDLNSGRLLRWDGTNLRELYWGMVNPADVETCELTSPTDF
jgi:hypothetical protein